MGQPKPIDNPEYTNLVRQLLQREAKSQKTCTIDLMKNKKDIVERKNISRKMNKLENLRLIHIETKRDPQNFKVHENSYFLDYVGFSYLFSQFLFKKHNFIVIGKTWHPTARRFSEKEGRQFEKYLRHYLNEPRVLEKDTIRQMFYELMMVGYAYSVDSKKSNGFDKINNMIRDSMAAERFAQMRKEVPIKINAIIKNEQ